VCGTNCYEGQSSSLYFASFPYPNLKKPRKKEEEEFKAKVSDDIPFCELRQLCNAER